MASNGKRFIFLFASEELLLMELKARLNTFNLRSKMSRFSYSNEYFKTVYLIV